MARRVRINHSLWIKDYEIFAKLHKTSNFVIPVPDEDVRGQAPAGIHPTALIPAKLVLDPVGERESRVIVISSCPL